MSRTQPSLPELVPPLPSTFTPSPTALVPLPDAAREGGPKPPCDIVSGQEGGSMKCEGEQRGQWGTLSERKVRF